MSRTAVLCYSGGLDTTCAICWLKEDYGFDDVVAVLVDVGQEYDLEQAIERGNVAGAKEIVVLDLKERFVDGIVAQAIKTNALYEGRYPLVSALSRPLIAGAVAEVAVGHAGRGAGARLHRQGQRPAPLRLRLQGQLPGREGDRAAPRQGAHARGGDRLRAGARDPDHQHQGVALLDRRERLRPRDRVGDARGSLERAARGRLPAHLRPDQGAARRRRS